MCENRADISVYAALSSELPSMKQKYEKNSKK
jgi:hypothetical protein